MKQGRRDEKIMHSMFSVKNYLIFFGLISFIVTCSFLLFLNAIDIEEELIRRSAKITFLNILFLSLVCTVIDAFRRKYMVGRPVKRILEAARKMTQGDMSARIEPMHSFGRTNELDLIIEHFNIMAEELSAIETLQTDFINSVSHELKTPLAVIQNYAELLQSPNVPEQERWEYTRAIMAATGRFSEMITNILKLNKLENQQIFPVSGECDLGEQLRTCVLAFEDAWEDKNLQIEADIDDVTAKADGELLTLVWNNLLSNAVKFTQPGGRINISLKEDGDYVIVRIADTGCGMSPEVGKRIFDKFYQGDTSHAAQGNGLGLALVKRVMDILGGEISVSSTEGQGSAFTVRLQREKK